jgi:hypothetical protein
MSGKFKQTKSIVGAKQKKHNLELRESPVFKNPKL